MSLAFIIPVIHPNHPRLESYEIVERMLYLTVTSLMKQSLPQTYVAIAGHRVPDWITEFGDRVLFLDIGDHAGMPPEQSDVQIDTGLKKAMAGVCAIARWNPDYIMLIDADDFVDTTFASKLVSGKFGKSGMDGYTVVKGYHAQFQVRPDLIALNAVFKVDSFDQGCGSGRIFHEEAFLKRVAAISPDAYPIATSIAGGSQNAVSSSQLVDALVHGSENSTASRLMHPVRILGRHLGLEGIVDSVPINIGLIAKGCGHGQHDGSMRGKTPWQNVRGVISISEFSRRFGLSEISDVQISLDIPFQAYGAVVAPLKNHARSLRDAILLYLPKGKT